MHTHRIEIFYGTDNDTVIASVPDDLHLEFFPTNNGLLNEYLIGWRRIDSTLNNVNKLFFVIRNPTTRAAERERRPNNCRITYEGLDLHRLF